MHGATNRDELTRNLAEFGGTRQPKMSVLAQAKGIGTNWAEKLVTEPRLDVPHLSLSEHVEFKTFLKQCLKEYPGAKPMFL